MSALLPFLPSALLALVAIAGLLAAAIIGRKRGVPEGLMFIVLVAVVASCSTVPGGES